MSIVKLFDSYQVRFVSDPTGRYAFGIVADDMAGVLDHSDTYMMCKGIDEEWKGTSNVCTPGGNQDVTVIWEPGVYQLLSKSRKPKAKPFQKWLFEDVLPSIRQTGSYSVIEESQPVERILPTRDAVDYIEAASKLESLADGILKHLLKDALVDQVSLEQNLKYLPVAEKPKQYTIVKVRAKQLGFTDMQIGDGSQLGRFVKSQVEPSFQENIGRYPVYHYEIGDRLDTAICRFFNR
jgi:prophage antirepressor-like protein